MANLARAVCFTLTIASVLAVWPPPLHMHANGNEISICAGFKVDTNLPSKILSDAAHRVAQNLKHLRIGAARTNCLGSIYINISDASTDLSINTRYDYTLRVDGMQAVATSASVYGAMYALETLVQLAGDNLLHTSLEIEDAPQHAWRGLMIDSGRRFFPVALVLNLLDTMAAAKLNVLHLHASDMCRFGVQSTSYPNLTAALTGILAGFYTPADVNTIVNYAAARGIRVVPEFDIPGHSRGFIPVESDGAVFCTADNTRSQLYGDPANSTYTLLHRVLKEMAGLFPDNVFHLGCDETSVVGPCTLASTFALERAMINAVQNEFGKTPAGWEEIYFNAGAATSDTIVFTWSRHHPSEVTSTGRRVVENAGDHFYFTEPGPAGPAGWDRCWYDIDTDVPAAQQSLVLGGEMSMWSDTYCYIDQCGASQGSTPVGATLFNPKYDNEFSRSIGGMIWPRGLVGAAAFWQYNASVDPGSPAFVAGINNLTRQLQARGSFVCPVGCYCDQLTACGTPYLQPEPLVGMTVGLQPCQAGENLSTQHWTLQPNGRITLNYNQSLCLHTPGDDTYSATLVLCSQAETFVHTPQAQLIAQNIQQCLDVRLGDGAVGSWECGDNQPNQEWSVDATTGLIAFLGDYPDRPPTQYAGACLTVFA